MEEVQSKTWSSDKGVALMYGPTTAFVALWGIQACVHTAASDA